MRDLLKPMIPAAFVLASFAGPAAAHDLNVVASFSILGNMVEEVAGQHATVSTIVGPNADAHIYTPSVSDARAAADADVIFVNGLGFETWADTLISEAGGDAVVVVATEGVEPLLVEGEVDPHAWNSLPNGTVYVRNIAEALAEADPDHREIYEANAAAYIERLEALDASARDMLAAIPEEERIVVTAHDAFGYLGDAYGLTFLAPLGIDTEAEPSAQDLAALIDHLKSVGAGALFVENITSSALVEQIAEETGIELSGRIYSDALSDKGGPATSYEAMVQHNLEEIVSALQSSAGVEQN